MDHPHKTNSGNPDFQHLSVTPISLVNPRKRAGEFVSAPGRESVGAEPFRLSLLHSNEFGIESKMAAREKFVFFGKIG
ncbi:MAG: hypothetical protein IKT12_00330, partial [Thermoguttaceae bacterium]|nr:hypothetical protein [Thermoguttaceae bacterium]